MEEKAPIKPAMVSRLPKFGVRPASPLPNGTTQPTPPPQDGKTTPPARPNGVVRASSFSLKWRKDGGSTPTTPTSPEGDACPKEGGDKPKTQHSTWGKEIKKPSASTPKQVRRSGSSVSSTSSPRAIPRQPEKNSPKAGPRQGQSTSLSGGSKLGQNGATDCSGRSVSGLVRLRASSSSPRSSSRDSLSQSSDSLKSLTLDNMVRSQSFTHFKQIPSPTNLPMARSFSFNRAVELAKPLANTQLQPPRTNHIKPHQLSNGRLGLGMGLSLGTSLGGLQYPRSLSSACSPSTTPSGLKKPLLPNCVLNKPSALGYRLTRPGQVKQQKPLFTGRVKGEVRAGGVGEGDRAESPPLTLTPDPLSDSDRTSGGQLRGTGEGLEDMSLSSASSLSRGDTSEEFLDDFDNLADGDVPDNRTRGSIATQTRLRSFLNETMDWDGMGLSGRKEEVGVRTALGILPPERGDFLQGSSQELSPSNSSGGTYMWDEEDLEPLGPRTHPCESYDDSDRLNSMDILNNLEPADLEDDDLMLDVDLPEDGSLRTQTTVAPDADGMAHFDCSERVGRKGHWRRRQPRWNGLDHFHNDNRGPVFQQYDGYTCHGGFMVGPRPLPPVGRHDGYSGALDEITLKHMAQDCSSVKNKLLKLKSLLQMEDGGPEVVEEGEEDNSTTLQLEELMKEVRELREELRNKERTITQLTLQQQAPAHDDQPGRCHCHQRAPSLGGDRQTHHDKATQTPWRGQGNSHAPQILQPSSPSHHEHLTQERLVKTALTEGHSDPQRRRSRGDGSPCTDSERPTRSLARGVDTPPVPNPDELSVLLSTQLNIHDREGPGTTPSPTQGLPASSSPATGALSRPVGGQQASPEGPGCPRVLQRPRLHKPVSVPALPQRYANGSLLQSGSAGLLANNRIKQLPPPSRGLPCFNSGPQAVGPSLGRGVLAQPRTLGVRRDLGSTSPPSPSLEMPDLGLLRARVLVPPSLSRLPKPKIH
ncbi:serine-rich coiled-coil domain-containing protein 2 isoform X1 [Coregonus clupeaformis]|uniref:serine-rich coiled-coil domain-containing protein 2 isoform X1 n=1 Tax=Coregonus clupeaformis TaxID=59861 RepID=UPI001BE00CA8|nr:serine-rich coiled-coil domain-containing protein 2 isoform X1 [Coregonus clupeaformis]XP_041723100.1 serine-rich coiled-coil domain-containing protein 2 isoform X1 [Coregonus clupeaformis]XP_041723101.1 serine-rich coiled-coil domain-containing protein 2 isoform X1 [Coregonus clupeaformis]